MKKIIIFIIALFLGLETKAQNTIVYGTIDYEGFNSIQKGAFWDKRPEAKIIFEGGRPSGVEEIKILTSNTFIKFIKGEHNNFDRNYIIFPIGEIIYKKDGRWYSARCGNEIEYWKTVNEVKIKTDDSKNVTRQETERSLDTERSLSSQDYLADQIQTEFKSASSHSQVKTSDLNLPPPLKKKLFQKTGVQIGCATIAVGGIITGILMLKHHKDGNPGGAPTNTEGGGPGGANTTP